MLKTLAIAALVTTAGVLLPTISAFASTAEAKSAVNIRDDSSLDSNVLDVLGAGQEIQVIDCVAGWCAVVFEDDEAYISESFLSFGGSDDEDEVVASADSDDEDDVSTDEGDDDEDVTVEDSDDDEDDADYEADDEADDEDDEDEDL